MSQTTPGWYPDPAGKFGQRYHDGNGWTENVADAAGNQTSDPVPAAPPGGAPGGYGGGPPTETGFDAPAPPPGPGFGAPPPQQAYGQPPQPYGQAPQPGYGQPQPDYGQAPFGGAGTGGAFKPTVGAAAAGLGMLFILLGLFAFDWARSEEFDEAPKIGAGDLDGPGSPFFADLWGSILYILAFLVAIALLVLALRLPQVRDKLTPQLMLIAGGVLIFFAVWNLITNIQIGTEEGIATAFGAWLTLLGWGLLAVQFIPDVGERPLTK